MCRVLLLLAWLCAYVCWCLVLTLWSGLICSDLILYFLFERMVDLKMFATCPSVLFLWAHSFCHVCFCLFVCHVFFCQPLLLALPLAILPGSPFFTIGLFWKCSCSSITEPGVVFFSRGLLLSVEIGIIFIPFEWILSSLLSQLWPGHFSGTWQPHTLITSLLVHLPHPFSLLTLLISFPIYPPCMFCPVPVHCGCFCQ